MYMQKQAGQIRVLAVYEIFYTAFLGSTILLTA